MKFVKLVKATKEQYFVYDLDREEQVGKTFDSIEEAEKLLCMLAGIPHTENAMISYLQEPTAQFEVRVVDED